MRWTLTARIDSSIGPRQAPVKRSATAVFSGSSSARMHVAGELQYIYYYITEHYYYHALYLSKGFRLSGLIKPRLSAPPAVRNKKGATAVHTQLWWWLWGMGSSSEETAMIRMILLSFLNRYLSLSSLILSFILYSVLPFVLLGNPCCLVTNSKTSGVQS